MAIAKASGELKIGSTVSARINSPKAPASPGTKPPCCDW